MVLAAVGKRLFFASGAIIIGQYHEKLHRKTILKTIQKNNTEKQYGENITDIGNRLCAEKRHGHEWYVCDGRS